MCRKGSTEEKLRVRQYNKILPLCFRGNFCLYSHHDLGDKSFIAQEPSFAFSWWRLGPILKREPILMPPRKEILKQRLYGQSRVIWRVKSGFFSLHISIERSSPRKHFEILFASNLYLRFIISGIYYYSFGTT